MREVFFFFFSWSGPWREDVSSDMWLIQYEHVFIEIWQTADLWRATWVCHYTTMLLHSDSIHQRLKNTPHSGLSVILPKEHCSHLKWWIAGFFNNIFFVPWRTKWVHYVGWFYPATIYLQLKFCSARHQSQGHMSCSRSVFSGCIDTAGSVAHNVLLNCLFIKCPPPSLLG